MSPSPARAPIAPEQAARLRRLIADNLIAALERGAARPPEGAPPPAAAAYLTAAMRFLREEEAAAAAHAAAQVPASCAADAGAEASSDAESPLPAAALPRLPAPMIWRDEHEDETDAGDDAPPERA